MTLRELIREWLGINDIEETVGTMEERISSIEDQLSRYGNYQNQTREVLEFMRGNITDLIRKVERIEDRVEQYDIDKAKALLRRLRYNNTRIGNILRKAS